MSRHLRCLDPASAQLVKAINAAMFDGSSEALTSAINYALRAIDDAKRAGLDLDLDGVRTHVEALERIEARDVAAVDRLAVKTAILALFGRFFEPTNGG